MDDNENEEPNEVEPEVVDEPLSDEATSEPPEDTETDTTRPTSPSTDGWEDIPDMYPPKHRKKPHWYTLPPCRPTWFEFVPCPHIWFKRHKSHWYGHGDGCPHPLHVRYILRKISPRINELCVPRKHQMIALWCEYSHLFSEEKKKWLREFILNHYGIEAEELDRLYEAYQKEKKKNKGKQPVGGCHGLGGGGGANDGWGDTSSEDESDDDGKGGKGKGKGKKKGGKGKKGKKSKAGKLKGIKDDEVCAWRARYPVKQFQDFGTEFAPLGGLPLLTFKRRKDKLGLSWPYDIGSELMLGAFTYLTKDPDEEFNSRAPEYFDVQAMAVLEVMCQLIDTPVPDPQHPTQLGEEMVLMALNLIDWIALNITSPAVDIPDDKVEEWLALRGDMPKKEKKKKRKEEKSKEK